MYDLPHEFQDDVKLRMLQNEKVLGKPQNWVQG